MKKQVNQASFEEIKKGFSVSSVTMSNAETNKAVWVCENGAELMDETKEITAKIPKEILKCKLAQRDIEFSSVELIKNLRLEQRVKLNGTQVEFFEFKFGFVIPQSTNTWTHIIETAENMIPVNVLSGNLVVETKFFEGDNLLNTSNVRIYYV